jgi:hypothetical protein
VCGGQAYVLAPSQMARSALPFGVDLSWTTRCRGGCSTRALSQFSSLPVTGRPLGGGVANTVPLLFQ